jgi:hypothetical protein
MILRPLMILISYSISNGVFPDKLKQAKVIPCYKSGDSTLCSNYRPISILNIFSKIFEKVISVRLNDFINKNDLIYPHQYGFRQGYSTNLALITYINDITNAIDSRQHALSIFIDLSKAFDTLNHNILLHKLSLYGIRGNLLQLFTDYLSNRTQCVSYNNFNSEFLPITCGVPQGSILGPTLFSLYINDIYKISSTTKFILFADDTTLTIISNNIPKLILLANLELSKLSAWLISNKLSLNVAKTTYMLFCNNRTKVTTLPLHKW